MKKKLFIGISITMAIMLAAGIGIFYFNKTKYKVAEVGNYKRWKVYFDPKIFPEGISQDLLSIVDSKGEKVKTEMTWGNDQNSFFILPPEKGYEFNQQYVLKINSKEGVTIAGIEANTENISFKIKNEKDLDKHVQFKDENLENAIRKELNKTEGALTEKDLLEVTTLDARELGIKDISGISHLRNLRELYLDVNEIKDISQLKELKDLDELTLSRNEIKNISPLKNLAGLTKLALHGNDISSYAPVKKIYPNLKWKDFEIE